MELCAEFTKSPPEVLDSYFMTERDYYRDPFCRPNLGTMQRAVDTAHELGLIPGTIGIEPKYADLRFLDEAQRRIEAGK